MLVVRMVHGQTTSQSTPGLALETWAQQIVLRSDEQGIVHRVLARASIVHPGEELVYTVRFTNVTEMPLARAVIVKSVPEGTRYIAGSAVGPAAEVSFSVDGGVSWGAPDELQIIERGRRRPAEARDYTHLRWQLAHELAAAVSGYVRFRAVME